MITSLPGVVSIRPAEPRALAGVVAPASRARTPLEIAGGLLLRPAKRRHRAVFDLPARCRRTPSPQLEVIP
jgi:hypothetical protein